MSISKINANGTSHDIVAGGLTYCTCTTAADVLAKEATVVSGNFSLFVGATVIVKFTYQNDIAAATLNIAGTGAKPITRYGTTGVSTGTTTTGWIAGAVQLFIYDGTSWVRDYWSNTTYSNASLGNGYATCSTAAGTVAKTAALSSYSLSTGGCVSVRFTNGNTVANPTLNVNSKGAKAIYWQGAKLTDTTLIQAGDVVTFVYSSYYHIIAINGNVVTAGSYGPSANASPAHGGTFSVPYITVDKTGRVTDISTKTITLPTDNNTVYTHPTYTARTGKPTANQTPAFGGTATVSQITSDATGHVTGATDRTITIPSTLSNGTGTAGLIKTTSTVTSNSGYTACPVISGVPYYKDTNDNTNYYHTTGSWSGLTYTATANGGAGALAFTIPTGTSATTVALGNHGHSTLAPKASPALTGTPTAPTAAAGTNTTQIATTAFVQTAISGVGGTSIVTSSTQPSGQTTGDFWYKIL